MTGVRQPRDKAQQNTVRQPRGVHRKTTNPISQPHQRGWPWGVVDLPLRLVFGSWVLPLPAELWLVPAEGEPSLQLLLFWERPEWLLSVFINFPRAPVCRALPNAFPCFDRESGRACKWYFCKTSAACALSGVCLFIASRYSRYEVMLEAVNVKPYNLQPLGPQFCSAI